MRTFKQFAYGLFYLAILGAIFYWLYSPLLKPASSCSNGVQDTGEQGIDCGGVCPNACATSQLAAIIAGQPMVFHPTPSSISVMVQIQNPNQTFSASRFYYKFTLLDASGNPVPGGEINGESFVYASEIKYIAEFNKPFASSSNIVAADFSVTGQPDWVSSSVFNKPDLALQNSSTSISNSEIDVTGSIINNDNVSVSNVDIFAIIYSKLGQPAGISKTELSGIMPGQQQSFSIAHPLLGNIDTSATKIYLYGY
ncbi:MAG TPA: hypothetical protein VMV71_03055 [Candidatus Paceibacterota bacterium]|nr:hypothetical protein [Candidatus Paceibacterota bacterium]